MIRITHEQPWPLFDAAATREIERTAAQGLPPQALMRRAGLAVARLGLAIAPHARQIWVACGPGNNGGDGLEAAAWLTTWHRQAQGLGGGPTATRPDVVVTWLGQEDRLPPDARAAWERARAAGVRLADQPPETPDFIIDAMLGLGVQRPLEGRAADWKKRMAQAGVPVLAVDLPSGLDADTGGGDAVQASHTLSLLTLKPGLFTAQGRDAAGQVWFDDLGGAAGPTPSALLGGAPRWPQRPHASHKGTWGDVAVIGGAPGMTGAALLAGSAALHAGAGRVWVALLDEDRLAVDPSQTELMLRHVDQLDLAALHVACGCGGGDAVRAVLPRVVSRALSLVLDADALNALADDTALQTLLRARTARGLATVLTPHPLEAARLLSVSAAQVQADRLAAARALVQRFGAVVVLKGSGTVVASADALPVINPTGNARLATAGTGDVLAGMVTARLAAGQGAREAAYEAVFWHGLAAQNWPASSTLTAAALARAVTGPPPSAAGLA